MDESINLAQGAAGALWARESPFRAVFEQAGVGMVVIGRDGAIHHSNAAFRAMLGYGDAELALLGWDGIADRDAGRSGGGHWRSEHRCVRRDGAVIWLDLTLSPVLDRADGAAFFIGVAVDCTDRRRAVDALRRSEARDRAILAAVPDLLLLLDRDGAVADVLSPQAPELARQAARHLSPAAAALLADGTPRWVHYEEAAGGESRHYEARLVPADGGQVLACVRDVSERAALEAGLTRAKEEAEQASTAKTRFLAAASHDLRQPLQALTMFVSVLAGRTDDPRTRPVVASIESSLDTLRELLNSLLDISKLDAGLVRPLPGDVPLAELLARLAAEYGPLARAKGLRLDAAIVPATARTDATLIERILRNLLTNAIRYTQRGRILLCCRRRGAFLRIQVWDTGIGIPEGQLGAIFAEFYRLGEADGSRGLGLGLAIVERLCRLLDHRVRVCSRVGRGSMFEVRVPLAAVAAGDAAVSAPAPASHALAGACVVAIDDEPDVRRALGLLLRSWGCRPVIGATAAQALEGLEAAGLPPDAVIADYRLAGGMTGDEAARTLCRHFGRRLPTILITGDTGPERLREATASGLTLLHKPVKPEELRGVLIELLAGKPAFPA